jgi:hypothetical protein
VEQQNLTYDEKCSLIHQQTLELFAQLAYNQTCTQATHVAYKTTLLQDELHYALFCSYLNELLVVHEKAKCLLNLLKVNKLMDSETINKEKTTLTLEDVLGKIRQAKESQDILAKPTELDEP